MDINYLNEYIPKNKFDIDSVLNLYNLNDEEIHLISKQLIEWIQDYNWPVAPVLASFLIAKQNLMIDAIKSVINSKNSDGCWKYWVVKELISYYSLNNIEQLYSHLIRIVEDPTKDEQLEEVDEAARTLLFKYKRRKALISLNNPFDTDFGKRLFALSETDMHDVVYDLLKSLTELNKEVLVSVEVYLIAKQDSIINDVVAVLKSKDIDNKRKGFLIKEIVDKFSSTNQQIINSASL